VQVGDELDEAHGALGALQHLVEADAVGGLGATMRCWMRSARRSHTRSRLPVTGRAGTSQSPSPKAATGCRPMPPWSSRWRATRAAPGPVPTIATGLPHRRATRSPCLASAGANGASSTVTTAATHTARGPIGRAAGSTRTAKPSVTLARASCARRPRARRAGRARSRGRPRSATRTPATAGGVRQRGRPAPARASGSRWRRSARGRPPERHRRHGDVGRGEREAHRAALPAPVSACAGAPLPTARQPSTAASG
jgi:hypothetical protein